MPGLLEKFPYPFHEPMARELHLALCQIYPASKAALFVAQKAGLQPFMINADQAPFLIWKDVLEQASTGQRLRELVTIATQEFPSNPKKEFFQALLADQTPAAEWEPRSTEGAPQFRHGNDEVLEPEALLFHDDLTLSIGQLPALIHTLQRLQAIAPSVCKLEVKFPGARGLGTAFRIGSELLLTNHHVFFHTGNQASAVTALFGYEENDEGEAVVASPITCDPASVQSNSTDDWAVIRVSQPLPDTIPVLSLAQGVAAEKDSSAYIIQHPFGDRKRLAYARNRITFVNDQVVQYLCDTQTGSSGAPVLNKEGRLVALHHAGGRPQEIAGKPPIQKNEGIQIKRVMQGIQQAGIVI